MTHDTIGNIIGTHMNKEKILERARRRAEGVENAKTLRSEVSENGFYDEPQDKREIKMNWEEIKSTVESNGNVVTLSMEVLRNAAGAGRLGVNVRYEISGILAGMGLGHIPVDLPAYHYEQVRLYKKGTAVGKMIDIMLEPGESNDRQLIERLGSEQIDYAAIIERIRDLVND